MSEIFILEQLHNAGPLLKVQHIHMCLVAHLAQQWMTKEQMSGIM